MSSPYGFVIGLILVQDVEMAQFMWDDGVSLDVDILLGADLLYDPGTVCCCRNDISSALL